MNPLAGFSFADFHFLRPEMFFALVPLAILLILLWYKRPAQGNWHGVIAPHLLQHLLQDKTTQPSRWPLYLLSGIWFISVIALAGPTWQKLPQAAQKKVSSQVIVMDLSLSMYSQDVSPSRLARAKHKLSDILKRSKEGLTGLVVYAGTAHVVTPLTDDTRTILSMVESLAPDIMPTPGSDPIAAVSEAIDVLKKGGMQEGHIILLTDDLPNNFTKAVSKLVKQRPIYVSLFAIGTPDGAPITLPNGNYVKDASGAIVIPKVNQHDMRSAAANLGGRFSSLTYSDADINNLLAVQDGLLNQEVKDTQRDFDTWDDAGHWLVILLLPFIALSYRRGWLGSIAAVGVVSAGLFAPQHAAAGFWDNLWSTPDQQGATAWEQKQYGDAATHFQDSKWKASALYKNKKYAEAEQEFAKHDDAQSHFNRGNALAKQQKLPDAIKAYETALEKKPDFKDAKDNLELLKNLQQQQEQQQNGNDQNNQDNQNDQQSDPQSDPQNNEKNDSKQSDQSDESSQDQNKDQAQNKPSEQDSEQNSQQDSEQDSEQQNSEQQSDQSESDKQNEQEQTQNNADNAQPESPQEEQEQSASATPSQADEPLSPEDQQALQQWLERVPDEPGGLLRRKFKLESQLRNRRNLDQQPW